jgi:hypothetical protein
MKRLSAFLLLTSLMVPSAVSSQRWNAEEQSVLDHLNACWEAWAETVNAKDHSIWVETCRWVDDFSGWWVSDGSLWTMEAEKRTFSEWVQNVAHFYWERNQPLEIKVYDDMALIWYYSTYNQMDRSAVMTRFEEKRFEVFQKREGLWYVVGAMVSGKEVGAFVEKEG